MTMLILGKSTALHAALYLKQGQVLQECLVTVRTNKLSTDRKMLVEMHLVSMQYFRKQRALPCLLSITQSRTQENSGITKVYFNEHI